MHTTHPWPCIAKVLVFRALCSLEGVSEAALEALDPGGMLCIDITCRCACGQQVGCLLGTGVGSKGDADDSSSMQVSPRLPPGCSWNSQRVAVEVDGPQHSCGNEPSRLLGTSVARTTMLRSLGYEVVRVPAHEWDALGATGSHPTLAAAGVEASGSGGVIVREDAAGQDDNGAAADGSSSSCLLALQQSYLRNKLEMLGLAG